jgi:alcohol-forming fatty acyl-CoA reductase
VSDIAELLAGKHVLLTGVTGFVGEALLQRLLTEVPDVRMSVLVRPKGAQSGSDRTAALLGKPIFADAVEAAGGVEALMAARIGVVDGDLGDIPALPTDLDAVVHCAGDVSFDPPVDGAFATNVTGVRRLLDAIRSASPDAHYLHVSTAYVSGRRRGHIPERSLDHTVDVAAEEAWGSTRRAAVEEASRDADTLARLRKEAEREHGRAGLVTAAKAAEDARQRWVKQELVRIGTERARSLGWTDCYTFTKALGERVVEAYAAEGRRVTVYRPSIIESALEHPHPGWIEGFKMAEPIILAYGRGELPVFPANPDTTIDIVPIDHVVASLVAILAHPPEPGVPAYFHLSSGHRNPITFGMLADFVEEYFSEHPFSFGDRGAVRLPERVFPGPAAVDRMLTTGERAHKAAEWALARLPRSDRAREAARTLDRQGSRLTFLRRYLDLYREYAQSDMRFADDHTMALFGSLSADDRARFAFDTSVIDWHHYLVESHIPSVTKPVRDLDELRRKRARRAPSTELKRLAPADGVGADTDAAGAARPPAVAAFFDLDGTLLTSNVIESYLWLRLAERDRGDRLGELARVAAKVPGWIAADRKERNTMLRSVYREYAGTRLSDLDAIVDGDLGQQILGRLSPDAVRRIREHRRAGHLTVLVTGAVRPLTRPLAPLFDHVEAVDLELDDRGVCTGRLAASPLSGESRAAFVSAYAARHDVDLTKSFAYADSHSDLPMLAAVGNPVAVRPDLPLLRAARRGHWKIVDWASPSTSSRLEALNVKGGSL